MTIRAVIKFLQKGILSTLCLLLLLTTVPLTAFAATVTVDNSKFSFSQYLTVSADNEEGSSYGSVTIDGGKITMTASKVYWVKNSTTTVTVKNTSNITVTVKYTNTSGTATEVELAPTESFTQSVYTANATSASFTITDVIPDETLYTPTFLAPVNGTYTVDGTSVTADTNPTTLKNTTTAYTLVATPSTGCSFYGWISKTSGLLSTSATYSYYCGQNETVFPLFAQGAVYNVPGDAVGYYAYLDTACTAAKSTSSKQVIPVKSGNVYASSGTTIEIPSGVTLLLPYASGQTTVQGASADLPYANYTTVQASTNHTPSASQYLLLTVPSGTVINNNGSVIVGGTIGACASSDSGGTSGSHSNLLLNGTLNMGSNSILSVTGYVYTTGSGSITTTGSGAKIYQPFIVCDFLNGSFTTGTALSDYFSEAVDPFRQWSIDNIRANVTITSGNYMHCYCTLFASDTYHSSTSVLIGDSSVEGMIKLDSGATFTSRYDTGRVLTDYIYSNYAGVDTWSEFGGIGRNIITLSGGATYGNMSLTVQGKTINMSELTFWVPYTIDITMTNGSYHIPYSMGLLPGTSFTVADGAHLYVGNGSDAINFMVFDGLTDYSSVVSQNVLKGQPNSITTAYGRLGEDHYPTTSVLQAAGFNGTANLTVNGTLHIQNAASFGGYVQTGGSGTVEVNSGATAACTEQVGVVGEANVLLTSYANIIGKTVRTLDAMLINASGEVMAMEAGKSYTAVNSSAYTIPTYSYTVYYSSADTSAYYEIGDCDGDGDYDYAAETLNASISGTWKCADGFHTDEAPADHTCDVCGQIASECADGDDEDTLCDVCGANLCEHNWTAATCTDPKTCPLCGETEGEALGHSWNNGEVTTAPGCESTGVKTYACTRTGCGETKTEDIAATGHDMKETAAAVAPTCETAGSTAILTCANGCGKTEGGEEVTALGHGEETKTEIVTAATCTTDGSYTETTYCPTCDKVLKTETKTTPATGHTEGTAVTENERKVTCIADGSYDTVVYCTVCGGQVSRETIVVKAEGHKWVDADCDTPKTCSVCGATEGEATGHTAGDAVTENEKAATCTADGSYDTVVYCTVCKNQISRVTTTVPATGHTEGDAVTENEVAASCTADGSYETVVYCTVCDAELSKVKSTVSAAGHTLGDSWAPGEDGSHYKTCTVCGATESVAHTPGEAVTENSVAASCTADGSFDTVTYCTECGTEISRVTTTVPASGHTNAAAVEENRTEATCTADGSYDSVIYCSVCGKEVSRTANTLPQLGHNMAAATCTTPSACTRCDHTEGEALGHTDGEPVVENETKATCTTDGKYETVVYCVTCKVETKRETVVTPAAGHTEAIDAGKAATCTESGLTEGKHCSVCGTVIDAQEVINALGHDYAGVATEATCTTGGYTTYTCSVCSNSYIGDVVEATGHEWTAATCTSPKTCTACKETEGDALGHTEVVDAAVGATCTETGLTEGKHCSVCDEVLVAQEEVAALGHTEVIDEAVAATCNGTGLTEGKHCSVCSEVLMAQETVAATGHTEVVDAAKAPGCTEAGLTEGSHCSICGEVLTAQETVAALGHTDGEAVKENEVAATCTSAGSYDSVVYCSVCSTEISRESAVSDALGHSWVDGSCSVCGQACAHSYVDGVCEVCGNMESIISTPHPSKVTYQIGLIEPWFLRINIRLTDENFTTIDYSGIENFGAYFVRRSELQDTNIALEALTLDDVQKGAHYTSADGTAWITTSGSNKYLTIHYSNDIYTYEMADSIIGYFYFEKDGIKYHTEMRERSILDLLNERKDSTSATYTDYEKRVYHAMVQLNSDIIAYRSGFDNITERVITEPISLANSTLGTITDSTAYSAKLVQQIMLIEPWGLRLNARVFNAGDTASGAHLDYNSLDDYGIIVYYDKDSTANYTTVEELLNHPNKNEVYIYSKTNGQAFVSDDSPQYFTAQYDHDIYTWQLDSDLYFAFYVVEDGNYYYPTFRCTNIKQLTAERSVSTSATYKETEKQVYSSMVNLYDAVKTYRDWYFANQQG